MADFSARNPDGHRVESIDDFLPPGEHLHEHLEDETLADDLDWQRSMVDAARADRRGRAYEQLAAENGDDDEPDPPALMAMVRLLESAELDQVPRTM